MPVEHDRAALASSRFDRHEKRRSPSVEPVNLDFEVSQLTLFGPPREKLGGCF